MGDSEINTKSFYLGHRRLGIEYDPLVIAEIGINHGGSLEVAKRMVDEAAANGAEVIKHQTHIVDDEMSGAAKSIVPLNADVSIYEVMERCALNEEDERHLKTYIEDKGMIFLSTPFSRAAADRLESMGVVGFKIGSGECNNYPLVEHVARFRKPMIVSTGMNDLSSIAKTVGILEKYDIPHVLLHTTNLYPTPIELVRLGAMEDLQKSFPGSLVGLSDHTTSNLACFGAVALGATVLERHFTDTMDREGPDIVNSMDGKALRELIDGSKQMRLMRGGNKEAAAEEQPTIDFAFASVVSIDAISRGDSFSTENIWVKRPGNGEIAAESFEDVLGKKSLRDISPDEQISWRDVSD